jgi:nicotinamidase-related amidase
MSKVKLESDSLITREDSVLVVIDVQEKMMPPIAEGPRVLDNVVRLLKFSQILQLPVILTEQNKLGDTLPEVLAARPGLKPIRKWEFGCFRCQEFVDQLSGLGCSTLILAGVETHICVAQTALQGVADYTAHVVSDATSSRSRDNWKVAIKRMRQAGVVVTSTEMVMYELMGRAGTDEFREVLPLVK